MVGRDHPTLPVDRGWAWAISAAGFIAHVVMNSSNQCNSVLFVEILQKYNTSITTGSLIFMCTTLSFSASSVIVTTFITPKLGEQKCLIIGGLMCSTLSLGASFAPSIGLFITLVSLKGMAHGFIFVPSISLIRFYFNKLRSRASIIPWCGGSASSIIAPFIIRAVRKEFGISAVYFILAAVELHVCFAGLLMRPVSSYKFNPDAVDASLTEDTMASKNGNEVSVDTGHNTQENAAPSDKNSSRLQVNHEEHHDSADAVKKSLLPSKDKIDSAVEEIILYKIIEMNDPPKDKGIIHRQRRNTFLGSVLSLNSEIGAAIEVMIEDVTDSPAENGLTRWQKFYRDASLELWSFRWTLLAVLPGTVNGYLVSYMPTISNSQGASLDQAALLVTLMGSVDLVSRICFGFIADTHILPPSKLMVIANLFLGIACHLFRLSTAFTTLIPMIIFIGMFIGSRGPLVNLMCIEVVGTQKMPQAYSLLTLFSTLTAASFNPILGSVVEGTGSFIPVLHIIGSCFIACACLVALIQLFARADVKHGRKQAPPARK